MNSSGGDHHVYVGAAISDQSRISFVIIGIFYILVGVAGNLVIIFTIVTTKSMRSPHYYFIANLALADIIIIGYTLPWTVMSLILRYYPVVNFKHCVFNGFITVCCFVASLISLLAISLNRYLSVCHNDFFTRVFSRKILSSLIGCGLIWLVSVLFTLPCLTGWGRFVFDRKVHYCGYDRTYSYSYTLFLVLLTIGVPVVIVFVCNFAIWRYVRQASHRIYAVTNRGHHVHVQDGLRVHMQLQDYAQGRTSDRVENNYDAAGASSSASDGSAMSANGRIRTRPTEGQLSNKLSPKPTASVVQEPPTADENRTQETMTTSKEMRATRNSPLVTPDELALIKTVFVVFITFAVLMSPYMISNLVDTQGKWPPVLHIACSYTSFTNSALNCVLYGLMTPRFRKSFRTLFSWLFSRKGRSATVSSRTERTER